MAFSLLFELVKEMHMRENIIELEALFNKFYTPEGNLIINIPYAMNCWLDEILDMYEIPSGIFRILYKQDILCDSDQINEIVKLIKESYEDLRRSE
jgi:hypothetical protein